MVVASAGNTREFPAGHADYNRTIFPAAFAGDARLRLEGLISVGAIDVTWQYATFATANRFVDVVAPGESVATFKRDGSVFTNQSGGTSYAAPFVSGAAAVLLSRNSSLPPREVKKIIVGMADGGGCSAPNPLPSSPAFPTDANACGAGLLNVTGALEATP
ncbi:MAG: S8 family serine peptidase [Pleurocapsa sp. SU_196_0]|nr:S8 family serine peptidase [Pleurocapsa sp. SU_196_0]